ncbi:MAG: helix-turn-helix domain-containing protein [Muribaculaceae bacterium]|nr:helix-turn-helix domain-containing protein [Muribaculaceae bacterium]
MDIQTIEYNLVLIGWVVAIMLGTFLLLIKTPNENAHMSYRRGKNTCAAAILLFGLELLFQWLIRFYFELHDPVLSVSAYLFTFCVASLLFSVGFCNMLAPILMTKRQHVISTSIIGGYLAFLIINYFMVPARYQVTGIIIACLLLFFITCISIYKCIVIYRKAISDLRKYYSDVVENMMRWMPGVGVGIMLFLITAPFTCLSPRWVGINQMALGIIMFIYTFICTINFSFSYNKVADAIIPQDDTQHVGKDTDPTSADGNANHAANLSNSLREVLQEKEQRWREHGGYRQPGITIDCVARDMGTNRSYLSAYLNDVKQMTFYEWVAGMRIDEAKALMLADRNMTIEQVANHVGFSSPSTFSSTFKRIEGISPNKWRNVQ